jgi:hypothetical protein
MKHFIIKSRFARETGDEFADYMDYSGIEYEKLVGRPTRNKQIQPELGIYRVNELNLNFIQLTLPDCFLIERTGWRDVYIMPN